MSAKGKTNVSYLLSNEIVEWMENRKENYGICKSRIVEIALIRYKNYLEMQEEKEVK